MREKAEVGRGRGEGGLRKVEEGKRVREREIEGGKRQRENGGERGRWKVFECVMWCFSIHYMDSVWLIDLRNALSFLSLGSLYTQHI